MLDAKVLSQRDTFDLYTVDTFALSRERFQSPWLLTNTREIPTVVPGGQLTFACCLFCSARRRASSNGDPILLPDQGGDFFLAAD